MKLLQGVFASSPLWLRSYFSSAYWKKTWRQATRSVLASFFQGLGAAWLLIQFFSLPYPSVSDRASQFAWEIVAFVLLGSALKTVLVCRPLLTFEEGLKGRDVSIGIKVGDILETKDALVVSTNTTFDTSVSDGIISPQSLQGQFAKKYYSDEAHLDHDLENALTDQPFKKIDDDRKGKRKKYEIGAVARINLKGRTVYMVAIADLSVHGTASGSLAGVVESMEKLWHFLGKHGGVDPLAIPVLGTGNARVPHGREEMIREIISSFVTACSESKKKFCEKLIVFISEEDYLKYKIDMLELRNYLKHVCRYTSLKNEGDTGGGRAV